MSDHKDMTSRHLRHKLQSLGRRLDELEEATKKLQKSEDELLDLQDKIIQAEGSNSSLLGDVEALRKRLLKIQGKDEEMRKAEDLCRTVREKLEEEENLTKELKTEIERLQQRMAELEKLEEAFGKSKSDCSQLCLSLNEEKNLTKKLSSEMEALKGRLKELEGSEAKLDRAEQALGVELEKLKGFTQAFVSERKRLQDKQGEDERIILKLTEQLERQKTRLGTASDPSRADYMRSHIENELTSTGLLTGKLLGRKKSLEYLDYSLRNKSENEKNSFEGPPEEDNKVKELTMEVERLKNRLKQLEIVEEDLKTSESQNGELQEKFQQEQSRARQLNEQVEQLRMQLCANGGVGGNGTGNGDAHGNGAMNSPASILENGKAENEQINVRGGFRQEKPKYRSIAASEPNSPKHRKREVSPQHKREAKLRNKELNHSEESSPKTVRRALSPAHKIKRTPKATATPTVSDNGVRGEEEKTRGGLHSSVNASSFDSKKVSVLSRYPPAANDQKPWRAVQKSADVENKKSRVDKFSKLYMGSDSESNSSDVVPESAGTVNSVFSVEKDPAPASAQESLDRVQAAVAVPICSSILSKPNGAYEDYRPHVSPLLHSDQGSEGHSSSETESIGSRPSEPETVTEVAPAALSSRIPNPKYPRYSRGHDSHSEGSSTRSSFDEELHSRPLLAEGGAQEPLHSLSGVGVRRVFSPREALSSKAVIKPAIVEIDRKEVMMSEQLAANGKPKISTKPVVTSSITIYPNDPSSSRNSSRSSSISSEPMLTKERHTSTSNILIGPTSDHRGSISIPYEISIPKSDIAPRPCQDRESASNDAESCFESGGGAATTTVTSWRSQTYGRDDCSLPETRNAAARSTWRNRGAAGAAGAVSMDEMGGGGRAVAGQKAGGVNGGSDDEASPTTWRAYRATTVLDADEAASGPPGAAGNRGERGAKRSPVEAYMRNVNSVVTSTRESQESRVRRTKSVQSPAADADLGCAVIHEPITSQSWGRSYTHSMAESTEPSPVPCQRSPSSWRRHAPGGSDAHPLERGSRVPAGNSSSSSSRAEQWVPRGQSSSVGRAEGRSSLAGRLWNQRPSEHH